MVKAWSPHKQAHTIHIRKVEFYWYPFFSEEHSKHEDNAQFPAENPSEFLHRNPFNVVYNILPPYSAHKIYLSPKLMMTAILF